MYNTGPSGLVTPRTGAIDDLENAAARLTGVAEGLFALTEHPDFQHMANALCLYVGTIRDAIAAIDEAVARVIRTPGNADGHRVSHA